MFANRPVPSSMVRMIVAVWPASVNGEVAAVSDPDISSIRRHYQMLVLEKVGIGI